MQIPHGGNVEKTQYLSPDLFVGSVTVQQHSQFYLVFPFWSGSRFVIELSLIQSLGEDRMVGIFKLLN